VAGITLNALLFPVYVHNFIGYAVFQVLNNLIIAPYWPCLIKYINNLNGEGDSGSSFGTYYLINGISGAIGNAAPLWATTVFADQNPVNIAVLGMGVITLIATVLVILYLDSEKALADRGIELKGDEPIRLKHVPYVIKWPGTWILFFAYGTNIILYNYISFMNPYLVDAFGMNTELSSLLQIVRQYATLVLAPIGGFMADKVFKATYKWYICGFAIIGIMFAILCLFPTSTSVVIVGIYTLLPAGATMALYSVTWSIMRELHIPTMVQGTAVGIATLAGSFFPMFLNPMFGIFLDKYGLNGYKMIFMAFVVNCIIGILNAMLAGRFNKKCLAGKKMNLKGLVDVE
ncbi:MAG: MFS transporter, partial [Firmicutes bacterium]|nr:MFS transporter [Bacillota bacterium]